MPGLRVFFAAVLAVLACAGAASAYPWPLKPFHKQHPIRGVFGDPRTVFQYSELADGIDGPGTFSFHNGVDIAAGGGTPVYAVVSGKAKVLSVSAVSVVTSSSGTFRYEHVIPAVMDGQEVRAMKTVLGRVEAYAGHVHLSEVRDGRVVNHLQRGHLQPYVDHTVPTIGQLLLRDLTGHAVSPLSVCGKVTLSVEAYDTPSLPVPGRFNGLPVAPALVTWKISRLDGTTIFPLAAAADFRRFLPLNDQFWNVYARGTYQNAPRFGIRQFTAMPGRFVYWLTPSLDTKVLGNGIVTVKVTVLDERGNRDSYSERLSVFNKLNATGCPKPPATQAP